MTRTVVAVAAADPRFRTVYVMVTVPPGLMVAIDGDWVRVRSATTFSANVYPVAVAPDVNAIPVTRSLVTVPLDVPALSVPSAYPVGWTSCRE